MSTYTIRITKKNENADKYDTETIYEQTVSGDETLVNGVVKVVLDYNSVTQPVR